MDDLSSLYKELLASNEGDILVQLKDGKELKIISFLVKKRSPIFKTMLESSMQEAATGIVDLSSQYHLEAFREFMAYIYYNKLYSGSYVPLLFEILCISDYYGVEAYRTYISDRIIDLIADVPICLMIASEALKHGPLTEKIYAACLQFLLLAIKPQKRECYDEQSGDTKAWCCSSHSKKNKGSNYESYAYTVDGHVACIYSTVRKKNGYSHGYHDDQISRYTQRCCVHGPTQRPATVNLSQLPDFIVDDINSVEIDHAGSNSD